MNKRNILKILILILFVISCVIAAFSLNYKRETEDPKLKNVQKSTLSSIDKSSVYFYDTQWITNYSQIDDGHYYWLRYNEKKEEYIIYRDNKKKIGVFALPCSRDNDIPYYLDGFVKYGNDFYAIISHFDLEVDDANDKVQELARVDLTEGKLEILYDISKEHITGDGKVLFCCIYQDYFYFDRRTIWQSYDKRPGISVRLPIQGGTTEELPSTPNMTKAKPYLLYMDNKIFYCTKENNKITLFCYDMQLNKEQQFLQFEEKGKSNVESSFLTADKNYIYCMNYMILHKEKKTFKMFQDAQSDASGMYQYTSNSKYVFYLDKQNRVHRLDKKTRRDIIVRKEKSLAVSCTEKKLYIRVRDEKGYRKCKNKAAVSDEYNGVANYYDNYADNLYCVNFDGKKERKIW